MDTLGGCNPPSCTTEDETIPNLCNLGLEKIYDSGEIDIEDNFKVQVNNQVFASGEEGWTTSEQERRKEFQTTQNMSSYVRNLDFATKESQSQKITSDAQNIASPPLQIQQLLAHQASKASLAPSFGKNETKTRLQIDINLQQPRGVQGYKHTRVKDHLKEDYLEDQTQQKPGSFANTQFQHPTLISSSSITEINKIKNHKNQDDSEAKQVKVAGGLFGRRTLNEAKSNLQISLGQTDHQHYCVKGELEDTQHSINLLEENRDLSICYEPENFFLG